MDVLVFLGICVFCIDHKLVTGDQFLMPTAVLAAMAVLIMGDKTFFTSCNCNSVHCWEL